MPYHLRYTPYELPSESLTTFCDKYDKYIIAREQHSKDGKECPLHYHIYIESDLNIDTIRGDFLKKLAIPKAGSGRNNKYYMLKQWNTDVSYICKQNDIVACKGFDKETLRVPPDSQKEKEEKNTVLQPGPPLAKKKESNFWNEIVENAIIEEKRLKKKIELLDAVKIVSKVYFRKGLPLPHPGDRKRWATSLVMYSKMSWEYQEHIHENIIEENAAIFISDEMIKTV